MAFACSAVPTTPTVIYTPIDTHNLETLWVISDVRIVDGQLNCPLAAADGRIVLLGWFNDHYGLTSLSASDGSVLWNVETGSTAYTIFLAPDDLFVGYAGVGSVAAFDPVTGKQNWSTLLPKAHSVAYLSWEEGLVSAYTNNGRYYRLNPDGRIIEMGTGQTVFSAFYAKTDLRDDFLMPPVFGEEMIYIRGRRIAGRAYAIDRETGQVNWQTESDVISNLGEGEDAVYMLTENAHLIGRDSPTGQIVAFAQFDSEPFAFSPERGGYCVAVDKQQGMVYAALGDSLQLFSFSIEELTP